MGKIDKNSNVKVKQDVMCPDYDGLCIGGWKGEIIDKNENTILICWDEETKSKMPKEFIEDSLSKDLDYDSMCLDINDVESN